MSKKALIIVFACLFVGTCLFADWCFDKWQAEKKRSAALESTITKLHQDIDTFTVRLNDSTMLHAARVENLQMTKKNLEAKCGDLLKQLSVKPKTVEKYVEVTSTVHDTAWAEVLTDTFGGMSARYKDDFANIGVYIDKKRNAKFDYSIKDSITVVNARKKHSILFGLIKWKGKPKTTVINHNPNAKITEFEAIEIMK